MGKSPASRAAPRRMPRSVAGKASGSRNARRAMYCAVHSPIPGIARSRAMLSSIVPDGTSRPGSAIAACANDLTVARLDAGMPIELRSAAATRRAEGNVRTKRRSAESPTGSPQRRTSLPPSRRAASTVICCPSTARTASSNSSQHPGARSPGRAAINGASVRSFARCDVMASMSAPTSNWRRTPATIDGSARTFGNRMVARRAWRSGACATATVPHLP